MKQKHSQALAALSHLVQTDFEAATRKEMVTAEAAVQVRPSVWTLVLAVKDWARALAAVCRSHAAKCSEIYVDCNERNPARATMKMLGLLLCDHLGLPADASVLLTGEWPEGNGMREFVFQVLPAPMELINGELITKPVLPRWGPKSNFARRLAGLSSIPPEGKDTEFLTVDETQKMLRGLEESFRNALLDCLSPSFSEAVLASYGAARAKLPVRIPPKKQDLSKHFDSASLTGRQREVLSLHFEHGMNTHQVAQHLRLHHSTIQEHIRAGTARIDRAAKREKRNKPAARHIDY